MAKTFKWTVEFEVDEVWVADGFEPTDLHFHDMLSSWLSFATPDEISAKILKSPKQYDIRKAQGASERELKELAAQ